MKVLPFLPYVLKNISTEQLQQELDRRYNYTTITKRINFSNDHIIKHVEETVKALNYLWYTECYNIVGIRTMDEGSIFNDYLYIIKKGNYKVFNITTDPGHIYFSSPVNKYGTAKLEPGQYVNQYKIDIHNRGRSTQHEALCQRQGTVPVTRIDSKGMSNEALFDAYGINIHKPTYRDQASNTLTYSSAGCQVFQKRDDHDIFMNEIKKDKLDWYTYTLLTEQQLLLWDNAKTLV